MDLVEEVDNGAGGAGTTVEVLQLGNGGVGVLVVGGDPSPSLGAGGISGGGGLLVVVVVVACQNAGPGTGGGGAGSTLVAFPANNTVVRWWMAVLVVVMVIMLVVLVLLLDIPLINNQRIAIILNNYNLQSKDKRWAILHN